MILNDIFSLGSVLGNALLHAVYSSASPVLFKDWNCCTSEAPCKAEMLGDCDEHHDCHGDMLCGNNNCGDDDLTGGESVTTNIDEDI